MKKVQRFIGVGDSKPASAPLQYFDLPIRAVSPSTVATPRPVSPMARPALKHSASSAALKPAPSAVAGLLVERTDLHKSLKALETLLVNLDEYRDLAARMAKVEKKLAKSTLELERTKVVLPTPAQTLQVTSTMYEALSDVSSRHAKHIQKEYEAVNDACAKYFKKIAKEERAHDELVQSIDAKIKKATAAHEKIVKKAAGNKPALESHEKYLATVQALAADIARVKHAHGLSMAAKSHVSSLLVASTVAGLADVDFKHQCEAVRRVGPHVGRLNELLCFTSSEFMPALQASELEEAQQGQANYLAGLAAQVEASVAAQAQINAKINEDTQTILRAQEMGWRPPSPLSLPAGNHVNLGRSSSSKSTSGNCAEAAGPDRPPMARSAPSSHFVDNATAAAAPRTTTLQSQPERGSTRPLPNTTTRTGPASNGAPLQLSHVQLHTVNGNASLDRAPTNTTIKSMAVQPQSWEDAAGYANAQAHDRDNTDSSAQEGSVVDKLAVPREESDAVPPSLSASNSAQGSDDGNRIPRTPDDNQAMASLQAGRNFYQQQQSAKPNETFDYRKAQPLNSAIEKARSNVVSSTNMRPAQRALEQYREQTAKLESSPTAPKFDRSQTALGNGSSEFSSTDSRYSAEDRPNARKISLWERERERMRQLEKEEEMAAVRAPSSSNNGFQRRPSSAIYSSQATSSTFNTDGAWSRSIISDGGTTDKAAGQQLGHGHPRSSGTDSSDLDKYAPAVGSTRLSAVGVTRSLSTDTTASERSFVARMKERYQAAKDLEREQRERVLRDKPRPIRRTTMDPTLSLPSLGGARGRVPEMASRYQTTGTPTYAQEVPPGQRYHDSLPTTSRMSSLPSKGVDEFGGIVRDRRGAEPPHSDVCGCHQCSGRHYGSGTTKVDQQRTMPRDAQSQQAYALRQQQQHKQQQLQTPAGRDGGMPRRSQEDLGASGDGAARKVMFAHETQTIR
uniref:Uncharacterized protein n=1 Tax=Kalmanozyma brasiliensis (strain GHG001) TaxID=1365824 RepID=V5EQJ4_KALBG